MRIVEIRELTVPLAGSPANALVSFAGHTVSLVAVISDRQRAGAPVVGFAFDSIGRFGQAGILRERLVPRVLGAAPETLLSAENGAFDPGAVAAAAMRDEKPGGHGDRAAAVAALELAVWDLNAKLADEPAWATIARAFGREPHCQGAPVYAAGGYYYPDDSEARLTAEIDAYRRLGFTAFKMKIGGASLDDDRRRVEAALAAAGGGGGLAVDANGRFTLEEALRYGEALAPYGLRWFEEPGDPLDFELTRAFLAGYGGTVATGENLFSTADARNLLRYGGLRPGRDLLQMDPGLSYGLTEYGRMLEVLASSGFERSQCLPHGGHLINLHAVVGLGLGGCEAYPGVFQPFGGYPASCTVADGRVWPSEAPGFGLEEKPELGDHLANLREGL